VPYDADSAYARIYSVVRRIPRGRVATYGQIARLAGLPGQARQVGYALHAMATERPVPWHRVINARGEISRRSHPGSDEAQRQFLERFDHHLKAINFSSNKLFCLVMNH